MEPRLQRRVQRYGWDRAAGFYEASWAEQLRPAQDALLERAGAQPGQRALDVACGTGLVTFALAKAVGRGGHVIGTDISEGMIERARASGNGAGLSVEFHRMDAEHLDLPDAHVDIAVSALGLMYVPHPERAIAEMFRVLRPGGRLVAAVWGARRACGWAEIFPIVERRIATDACPLFFSLGTGETLAEVFTAAGARDVEQVRISTHLAYASDDDAIGAAFRGGPVALAYSRFNDQMREDAHGEYIDSIAPYRRNGGYAVPGEFVIVSGRREPRG